MEIEQITQEALKQWGSEAQLNMVIEECAELIDAIQKWRRDRITSLQGDTKMKPELLSDKELQQAWDDVFDKPVYLDHKPTAEEILIIKLRAVAQAQRQKDIELHNVGG